VNTAEVLLLLVGIPVAVVLVLALLTLPGGRKRLRYKPGQPWEHAPVWYEPHPEASGSGGHGPAPSSGPAAVPGSSTAALGSSVFPEQPGERNTDDSHGFGPSAGHGHGGHAGYPSVDAGPLGGARGTW